jgi:hypothetical protein
VIRPIVPRFAARAGVALVSLALVGAVTPAIGADAPTSAGVRLDRFAPHGRAAWFGQATPGGKPVPFAPALLDSVSSWVAATEFSPAGDCFLLSVGSADYSGSALYESRRVGGAWTPLAPPSFAAGFVYAHEPVFARDGRTLTFTGQREGGTVDLWSVSRERGRWGEPVALPAPVNSAGRDHRGSTTRDGRWFFCSNRSRMMQVYEARRDPANAWAVTMLGAPVNRNSYEGDPCIAPDGRWLVFYSARDGRSADLYVSFRDATGGWGEPVSLGPDFNTPDDEYGAHLSADGRRLFFTRHSAQRDGIYWVSASAVDRLKR